MPVPTEPTGVKEIWSYPEVFNLGHPALEHLFDGEVQIEEKIDGSQISFGLLNGELYVRSKGKMIVPDAPEKMFAPAVEAIRNAHRYCPLVEGWVYRGEFLSKKKHNVLAYERTPAQGIILYDIEVSPQRFLGAAFREEEACRLGLEAVPTFPMPRAGVTADYLASLLETVSCLGGTKIEGVVIKNYSQFGRDKKVLMGKHVSEAFKETHRKEWKRGDKKELIAELGDAYRSQARWQKAVQHLREAGQLAGEPKDIGPLIREVQADILKECREEIVEALWRWAWPILARKAVAGLPEWYKEQLMAKQFSKEEPQ